MVYKVYVEKKQELSNESKGLKRELETILGIKVEDIRVINRYFVQNIEKSLFDNCIDKVFSEPQLDNTASELGDLLGSKQAKLIAVEALPGQYDQRADSAEQCVQIISQGDRPIVKYAKIYAIYGNVSDKDIAAIKKYVINPVEMREASLELPESLEMDYDIPETVDVLDGFIDMDNQNLQNFVKQYGLAMDSADLEFCQKYFKDTEKRNPTITEIRMIDTYWSDHCRHTTFGTIIDEVEFEDELLESAYNEYLQARDDLGRTHKPICMMDIATIAVKILKKKGKLDKLDESEEINACTVKMDVEIDGVKEPWLLLFKNETHNHPTEIEPFGGAATCLGGCIRDPLSGRAYAYSAMRVTGAADPLKPISETLEGKLPQRSIVTTAARGYSSYGNQIGLCTGIVDEIYHPGYAAKRMEVGAVMAAAPAGNIRRERPLAGDIVLLLGGSTGRDGIGGATGSSKAHDTHSVETCGAEVQKGNPPEERKIQRLFRNSEVTKLIKRCNDFGAGGVSVAIGELADGLVINLDAVPKKYEGLDGTELAISESQERMACVVAASDKQKFMELAATENLQCVEVALVTEEARLVMNWNGNKIVDISRDFLNSNGADKHTTVTLSTPDDWTKTSLYEERKSFKDSYLKLADDLNICSKKGLSEKFDSSIGAGTVLMPFGGKNQLTPIQAMVHKFPLDKGNSDDCSLMAWGYNPFITSASPYHGAYLAVTESISKLIASGASQEDIYLSFQEYFESLRKDPKRWGKPVAALLGALKAQVNFNAAAIGGKDSMSGSFENIDVPPTLISFAVTTGKVKNIVSPEFKAAGHKVVVLRPFESGLPETESQISIWNKTYELISTGKAVSAYTPGIGGIAEAVMKMSLGNSIGFKYADMPLNKLFGYAYGSIILELASDAEISDKDFSVEVLGETTADKAISMGSDKVEIAELCKLYEDKLESIFPSNIKQGGTKLETFSYKADNYASASIKTATPKVLIPVFPGTNCEYDSARAIREAGAEPNIIVIKNRSSEDIKKSVENFYNNLKDSQMIFIPGGFSGGDEPEGSAKFITAFFRNAAITEGVTDLLENRDGLMAGICNGFQALVKLGLVPYGKIVDTDASCPTLTYNTIDCHQSRIVRTRIASNKSPWLKNTNVGDIYSVPISHGEGKFIASDELVRELAKNGQIATQYVDLDGNVTSDIRFNPNDSVQAIEGITSPDGRVFGKMGHSERVGKSLYKNVPGDYFIKMFEAAVSYFK